MTTKKYCSFGVLWSDNIISPDSFGDLHLL